MSGWCLRFGRDLDAHRVAQQRLRQRLHRGRKSGREKQVLPLHGQQGQDARQLFGKAQVEQAVGFVEHQRRDTAQAERVVVDQVQQAPRRGHHDVGAAAQAPSSAD